MERDAWARRERIVLVAAFGLCFLLYGLASPPSQLFERTQNSYFPHGMRWAGREFLAHDWYANTTPLHVPFSAAVAVADRAGVLHGAAGALGQLLGVALLAGVTLVAFASRRSSSAGASGAWAALACVVAYVLLSKGLAVPDGLRGEPATGASSGAIDAVRDLLSFRGMAEQSIHHDRLDPARFGALALLGLGLLAVRRWRWAALAFAGAALSHASYLPHAALAAAVLCAWLWRSGERGDAVHCALLFGIPVLPFAAYAFWLSVSTAQAPAAVELLARERVPHHALPSVWWDAGEWLRLGVLALGMACVWRGRNDPFRIVVLASFAVALLGVALVALADAARLGLAFPWRASTWLFPIAVVMLLRASLGEGVARCALRWPRWRVRAGGALVVALALLCVSVGLQRPEPATRLTVIDAIADLVREHAPPDALVLVPARRPWRGFRLRAERAIYVDYTSHPFAAEELAEWQRRVQFARAFQEASPAQRRARCAQVDADFYVLPRAAAGQTEQPVAQTEVFALVRCDPG